MDRLRRQIKALVPRALFNVLAPSYHFLLGSYGALRYGFPSRSLYVVGVTGTKGKTSTTELLTRMLEAGGHTVALANSRHLQIAGASEENVAKRSQLGRTLLQQFLCRAVTAGCDYAVLEMTSEGAKQFRHRFIDLDALLFTNLSPEHIESHGSYENYVAAKVSIARHLERGDASAHTIVVNADDPAAPQFLAAKVGTRLPYSLTDARPYSASVSGSDFIWRGERVHLALPGEFNIANAIAAATLAASRGVSSADIKRALESCTSIPGRMEKVEAGQNFTVIVDYAHTADSLERAYSVYKGVHKICVLGGTGGGRDTAKRSVMGGIADTHCDEIILTTEDPYDEDPAAIAADVARGITTHPHQTILDRRLAIREAFTKAQPGSVVFLTGKGSETHIMGARGARIPWSDAAVAREELARLGE